MEICNGARKEVVHLMLNSERDAERSIVVLGLTPPYLAPHSHEALYEVDLGVLKSEPAARDEHGSQERLIAREGKQSGER